MKPEAATNARSRWSFISRCALLLLLCVLALHCAVLIFFSWDEDVDQCHPREVHLGVTEDPTTVRVTWRTTGHDCPPSVCFAPLDDPKAQRMSHGVSYVGDSNDLCGYKASQFSYRLQLHTVVLTDLTPSEKYVYRIATGDAEYEFVASKPPGDATPFTFFVFGDMGVDFNETNKYRGATLVRSAMVEEMTYGIPDLMLDVGDISYANGNPYMWEAFMDVIQPFAARSLWVAGVGNHEYDLAEDQSIDPWGVQPFQPDWGNMEEGDAHGECGLPVFWRFPFGESFKPFKSKRTKHFDAPPRGEPFPPFYYSFDQGLVHVVMLSTEHDVEEGSPQMEWLERDLSAVDRCRTPFVVSTGHRPFYAPKSDPKDYRTGNGLRQRLEHRLIRHGVDVYISGHVHLYYRLCEAADGVCVETGKGLVSMVIGSAGHKLQSFESTDFDFDQNKSLISTWGFGKFVVNGPDRMEFLFIEAITGKVLDKHTFYNRGLCQRRT